MTCRRLNADLIDSARGLALDPAREAEVGAHLRSCASCAALFERQRAMSVALRRLASEPNEPVLNPGRLSRLLAAFDPPRPRSRRATIAVGLSLAASVVIVTSLSVGWKGDAPPPGALEVVAATLAPTVNAETAFVVLPGATALPRLESGQLIRVEIPSPEGAIQADVLIGQDGLARAVRLVH